MPGTKKRKVSTPDRETNELPMGGSPHNRQKFKGQRPPDTPSRPNAPFLRIKEDLYKSGTQEIMESFDRVFQPTGPRLSAAASGHPNFVTTTLVDLRWQLANLKDLYGRPGGDVIAMGQEDTGQLGLVAEIGKEKADGFPPTILRDTSNMSQVAAGGMHSVALSQDGSVYTWGCGDDGALGRIWPTDDDDEIGEEKYTTTPTAVKTMIPSKNAVSQHVCGSPDNEATEVVAIDAGSSHTLFLTLSGNVYTCGTYKDLDSGHFIDLRPTDDRTDTDKGKPGSPEGFKQEPTHVYQMPGRAKFIAAGGSFNAAILDNDTLVTWGMGHSGQLARSATMTTLKDDQGEFELGHDFYRGIDGKGLKYFKEDIVKEHFLKPKPVLWGPSSLEMKQRVVTHVACGNDHILVAARDAGDAFSQVYSSGLNNYGKLGHGDEKGRHSLTLIEALKGTPIARVAAGNDHSIILHAKGDTIYACGRGGYGQLGIAKNLLKIKEGGSLSDDQKEGHTMVPLPVAFPTTDRLDKIGRFIDVQCGDNHSMAITTGGKIYTWGYGEYGQAGNDPTLYTDDLVQPRLNEDWIKGTELFVHHMSGGAQHSLIVASRYKKKA